MDATSRLGVLRPSPAPRLAVLMSLRALFSLLTSSHMSDSLPSGVPRLLILPRPKLEWLASWLLPYGEADRLESARLRPKLDILISLLRCGENRLEWLTSLLRDQLLLQSEWVLSLRIEQSYSCIGSKLEPCPKLEPRRPTVTGAADSSQKGCRSCVFDQRAVRARLLSRMLSRPLDDRENLLSRSLDAALSRRIEMRAANEPQRKRLSLRAQRQ